MDEIEEIRISVIIPTYNRAHVLGRAIESVLTQKNCRLEIIVVDDGSTDETEQVVSRYGENVHYIRQENGGAARARNVGLNYASHDLIAFLDSDDFFLDSDKLQKQAKFLREHSEYGMVYGGIEFFDDNFIKTPRKTKELSSNIYPWLLMFKFNIIFTPTVMIKKVCINTVGNFDENFILCEDIDLWRRISKKYKVFQFKDVFTAVHLRINEKYDLKKALYWRRKLYAKACQEDDDIGVIFKLRLYAELIFWLARTRTLRPILGHVKHFLTKFSS